MSILLILVLFLVLAAEFVNGWTDAPNAIATVVSTRVISPRRAVIMAVVLNILGNLSGTAVAYTIGKGIVDPSIINLPTIAAALVGIVVWSSVAARLGIPTSESHALVSGLAGAGLATAGTQVLIWSGWQKVFLGLIFSSILGFCLAWFFGKTIQKFFADRQPAESKRMFDRLQILSAAFMAYNHGMNDGQKFIGVFVMALVIGGVLPVFHVPVWVVFLCAGAMGVGTSVGGYKIISMIGEKMVHIDSWQGFGAELAASSTILFASISGIPLSTTQTITTSLMGVAASRRISSVRWKYSTDILLAWVFTFPICGAIAFVVCYLLNTLLPFIS
ncbi:MAG: inorganic phosphate transporter [Anaerolineales bacterium]|nr:inorganic phosphate transporter [Anaerolineales bacterium]